MAHQLNDKVNKARSFLCLETTGKISESKFIGKIIDFNSSTDARTKATGHLDDLDELSF